MLTIAISNSLADEHPGFIAAIAERGHRFDVFDADTDTDETIESPLPERFGRLREAARHGSRAVRASTPTAAAPSSRRPRHAASPPTPPSRGREPCE